MVSGRPRGGTAEALLVGEAPIGGNDKHRRESRVVVRCSPSRSRTELRPKNGGVCGCLWRNELRVLMAMLVEYVENTLANAAERCLPASGAEMPEK